MAGTVQERRHFAAPEPIVGLHPRHRLVVNRPIEQHDRHPGILTVAYRGRGDATGCHDHRVDLIAQHGPDALLDALDLRGVDLDTLFNAAQAAEVAGDRDRALDLLGRALGAGYAPREVRLEPDFAALRLDPRFPPLLAAAEATGSSRG